MKAMKKIYIAPEIEIIACMPASVILQDSLEMDGGGPNTEGSFDGGEATGAARGDWENIWGNM